MDIIWQGIVAFVAGATVILTVVKIFSNGSKIVDVIHTEETFSHDAALKAAANINGPEKLDG